jgi:radical SAM protein with 4Fe4S-binding SPASM domain
MKGKDLWHVPAPQHIQLYPTFRCNQRCAFCFNDNASQARDLSAQEALNLLDILCDFGICDLDIMGGEPFLLPWMPSFLHAAIKEHIMVNISTNGSLPDVFEEFSGLSPGRINVGVSLEGSSPEAHDRLTNSDNFEKAITSIRTLVSLGLDPIVKTVVSRRNRDDIQSVIDLLKELGVTRYYLIQMDVFSTEPCDKVNAMDFVEFMDFYGDMASHNAGIGINRVNASCFEKYTLPGGVRCAGGVRKLAIMPDGAAYPCNLFHHFPEFRLGNIFSDDFMDIWMNPKLGFFRVSEKNSCSRNQCANHGACTGGCPAHGYFHARDLDSADIRCVTHS